MKKDIPGESGLQREALPTDTHFAQSWHLTGPWGIDVAAAWEDWTGAGIRVAVFDDGIDNAHPDLDANYDVAHQYNAETGATQTNVSRHLGLMHRHGVLTRRKEGNLVFYSVADETMLELCRSVCTRIAGTIDERRPLRKQLLKLVPAQKKRAA